MTTFFCLLRAKRFASLVFLAAITWCLFLPFGTTKAAETAPPKSGHEKINVILISLQCLRPDHLGVYGYKRNTSSHIDELAGKSVLFENAVAQANLTPVTQMSVMTSQYPRRHGMVSFEVQKDMVSSTTLQQVLKFYDYTTAAYVSSPEFFMRYDTDTEEVINPRDVFARSFDTFARSRRGPASRSVRRLPIESLQWIEQNADRKFFLWIASGLLHMPYGSAVPDQYLKMYDPPNYIPFWQRLPQLPARITQKSDPNYDVLSRVYKGDFYWGFKPLYHLTDDDVAYVNARYDAGIYYTDLFIGELMARLEMLHLADKTLVVLHSSHGDELGEVGSYFHYDLTDTVVKTALLMRFPDGEAAGKRVAPTAQAVDIMPTILDYLDIPVPHSAEGQSLLPMLRDDSKNAADNDDPAYIDRLPWWEFTLNKWYLEFKIAQGTSHFPQEELKQLTAYREKLHKRFDPLDYPPGDIALRTRRWKLIVRKNVDMLNDISWWRFITGKPQNVDEVVLYDLKNDPLEKVNVAEANPDVVRALKKKLLTWDAENDQNKAPYRKDEKRLIIPYPGEQESAEKGIPQGAGPWGDMPDPFSLPAGESR